MTLLLIALLIYFAYSIYINSRKKRVIMNLIKAVNQAQTIAEENNQKFERILERLNEVSTDDFTRDYFFEKSVLGHSRMFTAPVHYSQERQVFVISAVDALNYQRELALAYPSSTLSSALEAILLRTDQKDTKLPIIERDTTNRSFSHGETQSTEIIH